VQASTADEKPKGKAAVKNHTVEMRDDVFKPKDITIEVGDTVTWVNKGVNDHTATADKKSDPNFFDTMDVARGSPRSRLSSRRRARFLTIASTMASRAELA
jgi:plastocyanin